MLLTAEFQVFVRLLKKIQLIPLLCIITGFSPVFSQEAVPRANESDLIHHGDLIDVDLTGSLEHDWRGRLDPEGFLDGLDNIEERIYALCRTESEVAAAIETEYAKFLRDPKVMVRIVDRSDRAVVLLDGAVRVPQRFQLRRAATLRELLMRSGGITDQAGGEIRLFRPPNLSCTDKRAGKGGDLQTTQIIKIADVLAGKADPQILSGDIITVTQAQPIYLIGGVAVPISIPLRSQITLSRAISSAGGLARDGIAEKVTIYRRESGQSQRIAADLNKIKKGEAEDPVLKPFDVVEVEQRGRGPRKLPPNFDPDALKASTALRPPLRIIE